MFGHRYFGARYFGPRYFGPGASGGGPIITPGVTREVLFDRRGQERVLMAPKVDRVLLDRKGQERVLTTRR